MTPGESPVLLLNFLCLLRRGMKATWSVNLSAVGGASLLSPNVSCLFVFIRYYQFYKKRPVRPRSAGTLGWAARDF